MVSADSQLTWQDRGRQELASDDVRLRLQTYSMLSLKCCESKEAQKLVGQLLGDDSHEIARQQADTPLMNVLWSDLESTDRTLRVAAARVLCLVAYENLANQEMIVQFQINKGAEQAGVTVGWVHVFFIPPLLRERYENQCDEQDEIATPEGLADFVSKMIQDNYALVYSRINRYYAGGCREFLPLCWFHPIINDSSESTDMADVPDPSENLVGFYLVPRQMQFPEQDDVFLQELMDSIRTGAELLRLQQVYTAFQQVAAWTPTNEVRAKFLKIALEGIYNQTDDEKESATSRRNDDVLHWLDSSPQRVITWNELLVWCCSDLNADEMIKRLGVDVYSSLRHTFEKLTLDPMLSFEMKTHVWESVFIGTLQSHPGIPDDIKATVKDFSSRYRDTFSRANTEGNITAKQRGTFSPPPIDDIFERPWEHLLPFELAEIYPISWGVFLSKWRQVTDAKNDKEADIRVYHHGEKRHHSVGESTDPSLLTTRKNALVNTAPNHRIFHSFRDLKQLRQQLPLIAYRPNDSTHELAEISSASGRLRSVSRPHVSEVENRALLERRMFFHSLRRSSANLDELTRKQVEDKQVARSKAHQDAATNRKKSELQAEQIRQERERSKLVKQAKVQALAHRRDKLWRIYFEVREERHQRAQRWKQAQHKTDVARQEEFIQQLERQKDNREDICQPSITQSEAQLSPRLPSSSRLPTSSGPASERHTSIPRRPLSARTRKATDPKLIRERAHLYGCAAAKAFAARRPQTARPNLFSSTEARQSPRVSRQPDSIPRRGKSIGGVVGGKSNESASSTSDLSVVDPQTASFVNACETLVMTKAAHAVADQITIPPVAIPVPEEETVPPAIIMAQYSALNEEQQQKLHERFRGNRISHKLTFAVLQQLTHEMRQDAAWREFLGATGGPTGVNNAKKNKSKREAKITHTAFANVATQLGVSMPPKKLQAVARSLDPSKTGFVAWETFYTWWSSQ